VVIGSAQLLRRAQPPSGVDQLVAERDLHVALRTLRPEHHDQRVAVPAQARRRRTSLVRADALASVRRQLVLEADRPAIAGERRLDAEARLSMLDLPDATLHCVGAFAQRAGAAVQDP